MPILPEEFAPTGPKLTRFPIQPPPPIRPKLFPDEARFAARLAILAGGTELAAWAALSRALVERRESIRGGLLWAALGAGALRALGPLWSRLGTSLPRPLVSALLLSAALLVTGVWLGLPGSSGGLPLWAVILILALPALADLAATVLADTITVERRAAAQSALEMGQGLGLALGVAVGASSPRGLFFLVPAVALALGGLALRDLRDRGTPRSTWPLLVRASACRSVAAPLALALMTSMLAAAALALSSGITLAGKALPLYGATVWLLAPLGGMALAAQLEARLPRGELALRGCLALAAASFIIAPWEEALGGTGALIALGGAASALPAAILRGAPEMERAPASSLGFSALALGAGLGALLTLANG